jgi:DNA-binding response OmpR family regulator
MSHTPRVLVVEDERTIADAITARLAAEGFAVDQVHDGLTALDRAAAWNPELVVLDVMLPGLDGHEVCRRLQADRPLPVLMLTARDDEIDLLVGLGIGADDYMTKPFSMRELVARITALLRRVERARSIAAPAHHVNVNGLRIDGASRRVWSNTEQVHLTPTEFDLLSCLAARPGTVLSRESLLAEVWGWADASGTRTVDSHVKSLRRKLGADLVRTVHGVGYALEAGNVPEQRS